MANNCYNNISITGDYKKLKGFSEYVLEHTDNAMLLMKNILPTKDPYESWGTNWFYIADHELGKEDLSISGDTAWGPAINLFLHLSSLFINLEFNYYYEEAGCNIAGTYVFKGGEVLEKEDSTYWKHKYKEDKIFTQELAESEILEAIDNEETKKDIKDSDYYKDAPKHIQKELFTYLNKNIHGKVKK